MTNSSILKSPSHLTDVVSFALIAWLTFWSGGAIAAPPKVEVSIPPLHSLVSQVMQDIGTPGLLIPAGASPHNASLKPSQMRRISQADIVFWIGPDLESTLARPLNVTQAHTIALIETKTLETLEFRALEIAEHHEDHHHGHHDGHHDEHHDGHHDGHHDHDDMNHDHHGHDHDNHEDHHGHAHHHDHGTTDPHVWLSANNAVILLDVIAEHLADADPDNAAQYRKNAEEAARNIEQQAEQIAQRLQPLSGRPFVVFHDAYQYFERQYGLDVAGAVTVSPHIPSSAAHISDLHHHMQDADVKCLFAEPQFTPKILDTLAEATGAHIETLDPLGQGLQPGPTLYGALIDNMAKAFENCLSPRP